MSHHYTKLEASKLVAYIAENNPSRKNRQGNKLYQQLVIDEEWAQNHSWTAWREHYRKHREELDRSIARYQDKHSITRSPSPLDEESSPSRNRFDSKEDKNLVKFLAKMAPVKFREKGRAKLGRGGNVLYRDILSDLTKYPWASTHPWQSWRDRYVKNQATFDERIVRWQEKNGIDPDVQLLMVTSERMNDSSQTIPEIHDKATKYARLDHEPNKDESPASHESKRSGPEDDGEDLDSSTKVEVRPLKKRKYGKASDHQSNSDFKKAVDVSSSRVGSPHPFQEGPIRQMSPNDGDEMERDDDENADPNFGRGDDGNPQGLRSREEVRDRVSLHIPRSSRPSNNVKDVGSLYSNLPTPLSDTPHRLPGGYPDSLPGVPETDKTSRKMLAPAMRSHPPTPPPTNGQSDLSDPSRSVEPDPPVLSAVAKGKQRAVPSPYSTENTFQPKDARFIGVARSLQTSRSTPHQSSIKSLTSVSASQRPPSCSTSTSPLSDERFATTSPIPKRTEVIHGLPKPREKSFRNNDRVRTRKVVARHGSHRQPDTDEDQTEAAPSRSRVGEKSIHGKHGVRASSNPTPPSINLPDGIERPSSIDRERTDQSATTYILSQQKTDRAVEPSVPKAPNAAPMLASKDPDRHSLNTLSPSHFPVEAADIFVSTTPPRSKRNHELYVLGTSHLPSEHGMSSSSQNHPTPFPARGAQWGRKRRQTFPSSRPYPGLPDINLVEELRNERAKSRSSVTAWSRGSPDVTFLPKSQSQRAVSPGLLSVTERAHARRGPPRKSVIPVVINSESQSALPFAPEHLSPSTFKIIMREGLAASFKRLEKNHGFSVEVVERTWLKQNMDLVATDKKLHRMRIAAEMAADHDGEVDFVKESVSNLVKAQEHRREFEEYTRAMHPTVIATQSVSSTDYTPPIRSRAGHYRRFTEQGRHWEARQREIDLASRVSANSSPSSVIPAPRPPVWGEEEDEALRTSSETALRALASRFGDKVLRQKSLALMMIDD